MERPRALLLEDDPTVRSTLRSVLEQRGVAVYEAQRAREATELVHDHSVRLVFLDPGAQDGAGAELLGQVIHNPASVVVLLDGARSRGTALDHLRQGVFDVVDPPADASSAGAVVERSLAQLGLLVELERLREAVRTTNREASGLVGTSAAMRALRERIERLAPDAGPVWFHGEPRTGKRLAARTLHERSSRAEQPFVVVDAGHPAEADARRDWEATCRRAAGGTLLVTEPSALDLAAQERCLAVLRGALGRYDVRLLVAAVEPPESLIDAGRLVEGWAALGAIERVALPALRDRAEDVPELARQFIATICQINQIPPVRLAADALPVLESHGWPGNVEELRQVIEQAMIVSSDGEIRAAHLPGLDPSAERSPARGARPGPVVATRQFRDAKREVVESFERGYLSDLLARHRGNVTSAAQHAGMLRSALQRLLRKYSLRSLDFRDGGGARSTGESPTRPHAG